MPIFNVELVLHPIKQIQAKNKLTLNPKRKYKNFMTNGFTFPLNHFFESPH